jgi:hypothetical protein
MLNNILMALGVTALLWLLYRGVQGNKEAYSKENLGKSFRTLGLLALLLIALIVFAVMALK